MAGVVVGLIGRLLVPGRQAIGWILTFTLGIVGAFAGDFLAEGKGMGVWWQVFLVQVVVAALLVAVAALLLKPGRSART